MAAIDEKEYTQSFDWRIWKRLGPFLRPYRGAFISMLVFNGICALVDVVLPLFQKYAIQNFIEKNTLTGLLPYALAYLAVVVVQALSVVAFARNSMHIEMNLGKDMRGALFHHLQTLSFSFYNVTPVGYLLTRVMSSADLWKKVNQNEFQRVTVASKIRRQNSHNRITDAISALATERINYRRNS